VQQEVSKEAIKQIFMPNLVFTSSFLDLGSGFYFGKRRSSFLRPQNHHHHNNNNNKSKFSSH
jgi:hypothetical protein